MTTRLVVRHLPGPNWKPGANFQEQPEELIIAHVQHYRNFHQEGKLSIGGPFIDADKGGMMVTKEDFSREELDKFASSDPAVQNGLLTYEILTWYIAMEG